MSRCKTPSILQMEAVECGAASLAMILARFGAWIPLEKLREDCGVSRDGSKASHILKAARSHGLECKGFRLEPAALKERKNFPAIVFWNFNHFLVLEGMEGDKVYLNDPARGQVVVTAEEFDESFTGVVLEFSEGENFKKCGSPPSIGTSLSLRMKGIKDGLTLLTLVGLALVIPGLVVPAFSQIFVDEILVAERTNWLPILLIAMAITALVRGVLTGLQHQVTNRIDNKLAITWTCRLFEHVLRLPTPFFDQRYAGDISSRIQSNDNISSFVSADLGESLIACMSILFFVAIMFTYDSWLTLAGISVAILNVLALRWSAKHQKLASQKLAQDEGKLSAAVVGGISMIETLKATGSEGDFFSRVAGHQARIFNSRQQLGKVMTFLNAVPTSLTLINTAVILGLGGLRVIDGDITIGMLVAFQALMASFLAPVQLLVSQSTELQKLQGDMIRVDDVFKYPQSPAFTRSKPVTSQYPKLQGHVEMRNISFGYSIREPALIEDFSLILEPGKRVALVGGSGSGKSTLARMLSGLSTPWQGEIFLDGYNRDDIPAELLVDSLAVVDQNILMFEGSIRENLTMWDGTVPDEDIVRAAEDACIHDIICSRTGSYDSRVAEAGGNFSGGQIQRMEIARALTKNPSILILDEATSALDAQTEVMIDRNIRRRGCTCIIVAHRLSTIRDCDEIIVLDQGKVVQRGTHDEMNQIDGPYRALVGKQ